LRAYLQACDEGRKKGQYLIGFMILLNNTLQIAILSWTAHSQKNAAKPSCPKQNTVIIATLQA
jgi:hypothetical protein